MLHGWQEQMFVQACRFWLSDAADVKVLVALNHRSFNDTKVGSTNEDPCAGRVSEKSRQGSGAHTKRKENYM